MDTAREAVGSLGRQGMLGGGPADVDKVPGSRFEQDIGGLVAHFTFGAAHHTGQGERPGSIANQHIGFGQFALHPIQRGQFFPGMGGAGGDRSPAVFPARFCSTLVIEGMQRLADLEHGVVGGIDNIADGARPDHAQSALHPVWAGFDFHIRGSVPA